MSWDLSMCYYLDAEHLSERERFQFARYINRTPRVAHSNVVLHFCVVVIRAQTCGLNEDLGLVKFVLSDKTGALMLA